MKQLFNLNSFFKFLQKNKTYTLIDIFGFSVSLMFVILIGSYTWQELSVDRFQEHADEIYLLGCEKRYELAYPLAYHMQARYPEIESVCPTFCAKRDKLFVEINGNKMEMSVNFTDTTFFSFFSFPILYGDRTHSLTGSHIVISESFANKAFPGQDPIGQSIQLYDSLTVQVAAVMKDIKQSVIPYSDLLIGIHHLPVFNPTISRDNMNNAGSTVAFIKTKQGALLQSKTDEMANWFKEFFWPYEREMLKQVILTPLRDFYFGEESSCRTLNRGNRNFVLILISVGILILVFAVINYVNLTVAQTGFRAKEMAMRRLLGSSRMELFLRLMLESTLLCLLSFGIALLLAFSVESYASDLLQSKIYLKETLTPIHLLASLGVVILIGIIAGILPALIISNAQPIEVVRGRFRTKSKMVFSKFFITFQQLITIVMLACSLTMILQIRHLIHAPLGYKTHHIIDVSAFSIEESKKTQTFINELRNLSCVTNVGISQGSPMGGQNNWTTSYRGRNISFQQFKSDQAFCDILGIEFLKDHRTSQEDKGLFLSEEAIRQMGITGDEPSISYESSSFQFPLLGVIKDFHLGNITGSLFPIMLQIKKTEEIDPWNILVEVNGDPYEAMKQVSDLWKELTGLENFSGKYIDQQIQDSFESQNRIAKIIGLFTAIAIVISLLGLLAMSTYFIQQRTTEISIRKVFGSSNREILIKLITSFLMYVGIAFIISIPIIRYVMEKWLSDYSYRISLSPLIYLSAGLFCLLISFGTVFFQSWKAANRNPIESFRNRQQ